MARFEAFWDVACDYQDFLWIGVMLTIFLLILTLFSLIWVRPGTGSYYISLLNLALIAVFGTGVGGMFWMCRRKQTKRY